MYPIKEIPKYYVSDADEDGGNKVNITLPSLFRRLLSVEVGQEVMLFFDEKEKLICIKKASPYCNDCGTLGEEEKIAEIYKDLYFCEKCFNNFMMKNFERELSI